jgi:hypothetical protein
VFVAALAGCESPEAARVRGGGPGADTGNRGEVVLMHQGSLPYYRTPKLVAAQGAPSESAEHAHQLSLP